MYVGYVEDLPRSLLEGIFFSEGTIWTTYPGRSMLIVLSCMTHNTEVHLTIFVHTHTYIYFRVRDILTEHDTTGLRVIILIYPAHVGCFGISQKRTPPTAPTNNIAILSALHRKVASWPTISEDPTRVQLQQYVREDPNVPAVVSYLHT